MEEYVNNAQSYAYQLYLLEVSIENKGYNFPIEEDVPFISNGGDPLHPLLFNAENIGIVVSFLRASGINFYRDFLRAEHCYIGFA
jgi:hypothetical protein